METSPKSFTLLGNHPNPFNPSTVIEFLLPSAGEVKLSIYDITGQKVRDIVRGSLSAGRNTLVWNGLDDAGRAASSGMYLYRIRAGGNEAVGRMMMVK